MLGLLALGALMSACKRDTPAEPVATNANDAGPSLEEGTRAPSRLARDDAGHLIPRSTPPPLASGDVPPPSGRTPDWDLDSNDPARDYVDRYVRATNRYGDKTPCVRASASKVDGARTLVETHDVKDAPCNAGGALRDVFAVNTVDDRLTLADPGKGAALAKWPDGSAPDGPPTEGAAAQEDSLTVWRFPLLRDAVKALSLAPIRVQYYGRGSYPVITLAGWHGDIAPGGSDALINDAAKKLCVASKGGPMAFFGGLDRKNILRIRCPESSHWEKL